MRFLVIQEGLGVELLFLHIERSQLRWFRRLVRMPTGLLKWCSRLVPPVGGCRADPGPIGEIISLGLPGESLSVMPEEQEETAGEREVLASLLR